MLLGVPFDELPLRAGQMHRHVFSSRSRRWSEGIRSDQVCGLGLLLDQLVLPIAVP